VNGWSPGLVPLDQSKQQVTAATVPILREADCRGRNRAPLGKVLKQVADLDGKP
jgi:hypothetical protein